MRKFDMKKFNTPYWRDSINKKVLSFNYDVRNEKKNRLQNTVFFYQDIGSYLLVFILIIK